MANPHRGEISLTTGDETFTLSFSVNALCELEDAFGRSPIEVISELEKAESDPSSVDWKAIRTLIWGSLIDHHPDLTLADAGRLTSNVGIPATLQKVGEALALAFPATEEKKETRPRKAKAG